MTPHAAPAVWRPSLQGLARIIFGFLVLRRGMDFVLGYPDPSEAPLASYLGLLELVSFPAGILIMFGLYTRHVSLILAVMYGVYWFVGPLQAALSQPRYVFGARGGSDPTILNAFFFLYLWASGPGAFSLDRRRDPEGTAALEARPSPYTLGMLRIVAGFLFLHHGLEKWFGVSGGRGVVTLTTIRGVAGLLENVGGPLLMLGLFTRSASFILSGMMATAYFMNHAPEGFWGSFAEPNMESAIQNCFLFLFLWSSGPGAWSLDGVRVRRRTRGAAALDDAGKIRTERSQATP